MFTKPWFVNTLLLGSLTKNNVFGDPFEDFAWRTKTLNEVFGPVTVVDVKVDDGYSFYLFSLDIE